MKTKRKNTPAPRVCSCLVAVFIVSSGLFPTLSSAERPSSSVPTQPVISKTRQEVKKPLVNFQVNPLIRFKNSKFQVLAGKKEPNSAIYINDQEVIPPNPYNTWYYEYPAGDNKATLSVGMAFVPRKQVAKASPKDAAPLNVEPPVITGFKFDPQSKDFILTIKDPPGILAYNIYYANSLNPSGATSPFILAQSNYPVSGTGTTQWRDNGTYTKIHPADPSIKMRIYKLEVAKVDTTPPAGSIKINSDAIYTNTTSVTLNFSAQDNTGGSGLSSMQFSNDNITWSTPENYSTNKAWTLASEDGNKTVYVKFSDKAGNWSQSYLDAITLDTTPPVIIIASPQNNAVVEDSPVQLQGTVDGVAFSESRSLNPGENTLTKAALDAAGNSSSASVIVYLDMGELIGPDGGEVSSSDGKVKVIIPAGAITTPTRIRVSKINKDTLQEATPRGKGLLSVVECKPYGLVFAKLVQIIYSLEQAEIPGTSVELGFYDAAQDKIIPLGQTTTVPADGYTVNFSVIHFSTYAALKSLTPQSTPIGSGVKIPLPDLLTGSFGHAIPITVPPGRKGIQPQLALSYRSSNPNSWVGLGFSLNPGYIVRSTRLGPPKYIDNQDTFYFITDAGTTELVNLIDNLYQAKVEGSFTKFFKETDDSWRAVAKDGTSLRLGQTLDSKETSSSGSFAWYLTKVTDTNGNYIAYSYSKDQGKSYLSRIDYTGNENGVSPTNSVEFSFESRKDVPSSYISTSRIATARRLKEIRVKVGSDLAWRYALEYNYSPDTNRSLLKLITQYASDDKSLPAQTLSYQQAK